MKLIIDISDERYEDIKRIASVQMKRRTETCEQIIAKGMPIEDIKAELKKLADDEWNQNVGNYAQGIEDAIEIIDEHINGKGNE